MADLDHLSAPHMAPPAPASRTLAFLNGPACRACGCTEGAACIEPFSGDPCAWWSDDICTACAGIVQRFFSPAELTFLLHAAGGGELNLTRPDAASLTGEGVLDLRARLACLAPKKDQADER